LGLLAGIGRRIEFAQADTPYHEGLLEASPFVLRPAES
jgi:hypothetical protein